MNDTIFSKSFKFNIIKFNKFHVTDHTSTPAAMHYLGCIIKGSAEIRTKKERLLLKPNEIFYIPKGLKYQSLWFAENNESIELYSFGFEFSPVNKPFMLQKINCTEKAREIFAELCREIPMTDRGIGRLYYFFCEAADGMKYAKSPNINPTLEKAVEYITENSGAKISDIAKHCNISTSGIYSLFKKELNKTPNEIRQEILCEKAVLLLTTTDKSVRQISDDLSFSSTSYFRKVLFKITKKTPRQIRSERMLT